MNNLPYFEKEGNSLGDCASNLIVTDNMILLLQRQWRLMDLISRHCFLAIASDSNEFLNEGQGLLRGYELGFLVPAGF